MSGNTMTSLTFYGGANEIGGNKILLEDGDTRIFLDHGESFGFGSEFFTEWLGPRTSRFGLRDLFALNLMPKIKGLYSEEMLEPTDFKYAEPEFQGIFLTHPHVDHIAHIAYVDKGIPVYLGATARRIVESWETTSSSAKFGDHDYRTFKTGDRIKIDDLEILPIHVDHSTPSAYGFVIYTSQGPVVYTGDFRKHGPMAKMTGDFIEKAKKDRPIAMICEGTRVAAVEKRKNFTEKEVRDYCHNIITNTNKLVVTCFYPKDVDRMKTYHELAKKTGRKFVISTRAAHLLDALLDDPGIKVPNPLKDGHMLIYKRMMDRHHRWEGKFLDKAIDADYVHKHQSKLILHLDFTHFTELVDIKPDQGARFIHSMSEPFEEGDVEDEVKHNWMDYFGLEYHQAHASGHCSKKEIFSVVNEISPKVVIPVHTEYPEMFKGEVKVKVVPPEAGEMTKL